MTREEAIKAIKSHCYFANLVPVGKEALDMAIKDLEQEPCEDCISREYILSKAHCCCDDLADDEPCCVDVDDIKEAPSIQPKPKTECSCEQIKWERDVAIEQLKELGYGLGEKPKTGHWIVYEDCEGKTRRCVCDRCRHETGDYTWKNPNFCENCGAKMVEPFSVR